MQLQITFNRDSTSTDADAAIRAIRALFPTAGSVCVSGDPNVSFENDIAETIARFQRAGGVELTSGFESPAGLTIDRKEAAGIFTAAELANDAEPVTAIVNLDTNIEIDPATIGFGGPAAISPADVQPVLSTVVTQGGAHVATIPLSPTGIAVDSKGLPHDPRIHASTKTKIADGSWKRKPRVEPEYVATVEAELRSIMAIPAPAALPAALPPAPVALPPPPAALPPAPVALPPPPVALPPAPVALPPPPVALPPAAPVTSVAPPTPAADAAPTTFATLMQWLAPRLTAGTINRTQVGEACAAQGLKDAQGVGSVALLQQRPDLVPAVYAALVGA